MLFLFAGVRILSSSSVESLKVVKSVCVDGYECSRNLCCNPRSNFQCPRYVVVRRSGFTPRFVKRDFSKQSFVVSARVRER